MSPDVVGVLAQALVQHGQTVGAGGVRLCFCGEWRSNSTDVHKNSLLSHAEHVASVVAALPNIAIVPTGDTTRRYSAAYRDTFGTVVPVGVDYRKRAWAEETRDEWKRDDPTVDVFIAYRDVPEWQEADQ